MNGLHIPNCFNNFKLSAYADDVIVLISGTNYVNVLLKTLDEFKTLCSAKVNWKKSQAILTGSRGEPKLPDGLRWTREGLKYLGVFLGNENDIKTGLEIATTLVAYAPEI